MTAAPTENLSTEGVRTLEVRWIFPGELASATAAWFARFPVSLPGHDSAGWRPVSKRPQALGVEPGT